jgi:hypothetical protein
MQDQDIVIYGAEPVEDEEDDLYGGMIGPGMVRGGMTRDEPRAADHWLQLPTQAHIVGPASAFFSIASSAFLSLGLSRASAPSPRPPRGLFVVGRVVRHPSRSSIGAVFGPRIEGNGGARGAPADRVGNQA